MNCSPLRGPLIGKHIRITSSTHTTLIGKEGVVTNETKNTITINNQTIIKDQVTIEIDGKEILGKDITKTPTERIKVHKQ